MRRPPLFFLFFALLGRLKFHRLRAIIFVPNVVFQLVKEKPFRKWGSLVPTSWKIQSRWRRYHEIPAHKRERGGVATVHDCYLNR
jgi:hypothetical protein